MLNCCAITHKIQLISPRGELFALLCWMPSDNHSLHPRQAKPQQSPLPFQTLLKKVVVVALNPPAAMSTWVPRKGSFLCLQQTLSPCSLRCEDALHQRPAHPEDHCSHNKQTRASRLLLWFKTSCTQRGPWLGAAESSSCKCYSGHQGCVLDMPSPACSEFSSFCCQTQPQESFSRQVILNWTHRDIFLCKFTFKPGNL